MNKILVQLEPGNRYDSGASVFLLIDGAIRARVAFDIGKYSRVLGRFDVAAAEFSYFTSVIYACDRAIKRDVLSGDRWTREIFVTIPVTDPDLWNSNARLAETMLEFLTGDLWRLDFIASETPLFGSDFNRKRQQYRVRPRMRGGAVSLFSGGLDSLIGVINWLEEHPAEELILASTYDAQAEKAKSDQERLLQHLRTPYAGRFQRFVARTGLCSGGQETSFRSRSLPFLGNALLAASFIGENTKILVPENGGIALNFPLTPARRGSLSTRTVHPYFIEMLNAFIVALGFHYTIENPYRFDTKGEMMNTCLNKNILRVAYKDSASCGKRGFDRIHWSDKSLRGCGACVPCIYRRAAILKAGFPEERYGYDLRDRNSWQRDILHANSDLQAVLDFIEANLSPKDIWRTLRANAVLDLDSRDKYVALIQRLRVEVEEWGQSVGLI